MALTLAQAALNTQNKLQRKVMETFVQKSSVLDRIPFLTIEGNAYAYNEELALPGIEFRAVNAAYAESTGTINQKTETLVILGGDADVDTFLQATRGNLVDLRTQQLTLKVKAISYKYQDTFINGDVAVDANSFDGLKKRVTGSQVIDAGTNGLGFGGTDDTRQDVFDQIDALLSAVPEADAIYMNAALLGKVRSAMRRLTMNTTPIQEFGKQFDTYNGIKLIDIGKKADGTEIIPSNETQGSSSATTSMYAVRFGNGEGDGGVTGLTNKGVQVKDLGELNSKPAYRHRVEFFCGLGVFGGYAAARLRGILLT
ncbi:MAG: major capsid protein [Aridibacter sp.]